MQYAKAALNVVLSSALLLLGCATSGTPAPQSPSASAGIEVPSAPRVQALTRVRIASGLANPRGLHVLPDGSLLVATAGTGDPANPNSGALLRLTDTNHDGDFEDEGERATVLGDQPSTNLLDIVRRDEVFGLAGMAEGNGAVLVSLAFFGGPSKIFRVDGAQVTTWATTQANINDLTFDPSRSAWYGTASTTDEVVRLREGGRSERVVKVPTLASGQDSVPAYLRHDPVTGEILVSLFSGSPEGEEGGEGIELIPRAASVVRVNPDTRKITPVVTALTVPTDLEVGPDGSIYVLEFCDAFVDPVKDRAALAQLGHAGFHRFSGRLLKIDRTRGEVTILAEGLDEPTNMVLAGGALYIAQGMGTPGRPIPGPTGEPTTLVGFIERITLQ
jgi:sugar lactone lactonase YvrE